MDEGVSPLVGPQGGASTRPVHEPNPSDREEGMANRPHTTSLPSTGAARVTASVDIRRKRVERPPQAR